MQLSKFMKTLPLVLSLIGLIYQLYYISTAYFSYASVTEITQLRQDKLQVPVFIFCHYWNQARQNRTKEPDDCKYPTIRSRLDRFSNLSDSTIKNFDLLQPLI